MSGPVSDFLSLMGGRGAAISPMGTNGAADRTGDGAGWGAFLSASRDRLRRMVSLRLDHRLRGRIDPSEVIQEAFLEATGRRAEYERQPDPAPPFLALLLYPPGRSPSKWLVWTVIGVGVVLAPLGLDLLVGTLRSRGGTDMLGMAGANLTPGIGSYVNLAAAGGRHGRRGVQGSGSGAFLRARRPWRVASG